VVNLSVLSAWRRLSSRRMHSALKNSFPSRFLMKQHFKCMEQSKGTVVVYGEVKIVVMLLNMGVVHLRSMCVPHDEKQKLSVLYFLKNLW